MSFEFLDHLICRQIATALLHFLWQGAVLLAVLELLLFVGPKLTSQGRYLASMITLGLMVICPAATFAWTVVRTDVANASSAVRTTETRTIADAATTESRPADSTVLQSLGRPQQSSSSLASLQAWRPVLLLVWLVGVTTLGVRLLFGWFGQVWIGNHRQLLSPRWNAHVCAIAARLGLSAGRVYVSDRVVEAIAVGFWRPVVLIPAAWMAGLPATMLEAVIAHELAHLRRWDLWANLFQRLAETLLFYHPAIWWVSRRATMEREMCCDELAVAATGRRLDYARALEAIAATHVAPPTGRALAMSFSGARQMKVLTRVRNVLGLSVQTRSGLAWPVCMVALAVPIGLSIGVTGTAKAADSSPAKRAVADGEPKPGPRDGEAPKNFGPRDGDGGAKPGPRDGDVGAKPGPRDGDAPRKPGLRDGEGGPKPGPRDGEGEKPRGPRDGDQPKTGARDGDKPRTGPRDGEGPARQGPRDGEGPPKKGPRDGEGGPKSGPRDGEGGKPGPREGDAQKAAGREGDRPMPDNLEKKNRRVFEAYDANRDNEVTFSEWIDMRSGAAESGPRSTAERERFAGFDRDDDGVLSFKEFLASRGEAPKPANQGERRPMREGEGKPGPREGEGKAGPREGERSAKPIPRDGEGEKRGPKEGEGQKRPPRDMD